MKTVNASLTKWIILIVIAILYFLEGVALNVMAIWVSSPLIFAYIIAMRAEKKSLPATLYAVNGFLILSVPLLLYLHVLWFFDIDGTKTSSSTSALIFAVAPVYAFILGGVGYLIGRFSYKSESSKNINDS